MKILILHAHTMNHKDTLSSPSMSSTLSPELERFYERITGCLLKPDEITEFYHQIAKKRMVKYRCVLGSDDEIEAAYFLLSMTIEGNTPPRIWNDFLRVERWTHDIQEKMRPFCAVIPKNGLYLTSEVGTIEKDLTLILPIVRDHLEDAASGWDLEHNYNGTGLDAFTKRSFYRLDPISTQNNVWCRGKLVSNLMRITSCDSQEDRTKDKAVACTQKFLLHDFYLLSAFPSDHQRFSCVFGGKM